LTVTQLVKEWPAFFIEPEGSLPCSQKISDNALKIFCVTGMAKRKYISSYIRSLFSLNS